MRVVKDMWKDFEETDIDLLIVATLFSGHLPANMQVVNISDKGKILFSRITHDRVMQRVRTLNNASAMLIAGPIEVIMEPSSLGQIVLDTLSTFRKAVALCRCNCERWAIPFISQLKLEELGVFLAHDSAKVRATAMIRLDFLTGGVNLENVDGSSRDNV